MPKVAVIFHHIGPYHNARLNAASKTLDVAGLEWSAEDSFGWGRAEEGALYEKVTLCDHAIRGSHNRTVLNSRLFCVLEDTRPDVVAVNGWDNYGSSIAIACCVRKRIPIVIMSESAACDAPRRWFKEFVKARLVRLGSAGLVRGTRHTDYLATLGLPRASISTGYDAVDNVYFSQQADTVRASSDTIRRKLALPEHFFLASNRFIPEKNLLFLLRAYAQYRRLAETGEAGDSGSAEPWNLVILGEGPLRPEIEALAASLGLENSLHLPGFKPYNELPAYYSLAGAFIHASMAEQWGLVVNEAMASGLPVIVSNHCGCAPDLVGHGDNGFQFDPTDQGALANYMLQIAHDGNRCTAMGQRSRERIRAWGPDRFAHGLREATECALRIGPAPRRRLADLMLRLLVEKHK